MEQVAVFQEKIALSPIDLHADIVSFDDILLTKLKAQLEGKCSQHGYVIPGSLQLLSRSLGFSEKGRGTADFLYYLKAQGKVYNPPDGIVVEGDVMLKNKMGCYVIIDNAVQIMVPRDLHIGNEEFDSIELNDRIRIEIKKSQFRANALHILSLGQFLGIVNRASGAASGDASAAASTADSGTASGDACATASAAASAAEAAIVPAEETDAEEEAEEEEQKEEE
jgi:DNA-directed RNA polymerase subunit E'/Rpb7